MAHPPHNEVANFGAKHGGEWAPSRRNLGSLFVCFKQKAATWENGRGAQSFDRDQQLACNHGLAANLHKLLFSSNWLLLVKFAGEFANGSQGYAGQVG